MSLDNLAKIDFRKYKPIPISSGGFLRGAHHPHCDRHNNHLIWVLRHPFCLGCTCMYSGMVVGLPLTFLVSWSATPILTWFIIHQVLLVPTLIQPWFQKKWFKIISRLLLGVAITSYIVSGLFLISPSVSIWLFRCTVVILFVMVRYMLKAIRNRYTYDPCSDCPLGTFPSCEWNLPRLLGENPDIQLFATLNEQLDISDS